MARALRDDNFITALLGEDDTTGVAIPIKAKTSTGAAYVHIRSAETGLSIGVEATDLDIRNLTSTDVVTVTGGVGQTADVKITLDSESVAITNAGLTELASAIDTEVQTDIVGALPAGTNLIGNVGHGKTIKTVTGTVATDTDIVAAVSSKRIKVIAYSLISASATSNTITFQSNASTALWTVPLQALASTIVGANLSISAPSFLFATTAGEKLTLDVSAAVNVTYSVSYFDDDAS